MIRIRGIRGIRVREKRNTNNTNLTINYKFEWFEGLVFENRMEMMDR